jgi:alpha-tubulin suppressor-like RCC1 family protein
MGFGVRGGLGHGLFEHSVNPVQVVGGHAFEKLYGGSLYSCGMTGTGEAWCWGHGGNGRLGTGGTDDSAVPVPVAGGLGFVELAPGSNHTCGITTEGEGWCWGSNNAGQLGDGTATPSSVPVRVSGGHTFVSMATSPAGPHSCGVRPDGVALCWGSGALGTGAQTNSQSLVPLPVLGGISFASITIGNASSCGLATDGAAWCWGGGGTGRLGNGSTLSSPNPTAVLGGHTFVQIVGSGNGAYCALTSDGRILCWGSGSNYRLGNGSLQDRNVPTPVAVAGDEVFTQLVMGGSHGCGLTTRGTAWCWGFGSLGRLGTGTTTDQPTPVRVTAGPFGDGTP